MISAKRVNVSLIYVSNKIGCVTRFTKSLKVILEPVGAAAGLWVWPLHFGLAQPPHLSGRAAPRLEHRVHLAADDAARRARLAHLHLHHCGREIGWY